jgi:hypothetical protein
LGERRHRFLGVDFTQELQDFMEEPRNHQRGLGLPSRLFFSVRERRGENW